MADLTPEGIPSEEEVVPVMPAQIADLASIISGESIGEPIFYGPSLTPASISSEEGIGTPDFYQYVDGFSLTSDESIGEPTLDQTEPPAVVEIVRPPYPLKLSERFSSPVINQNAAPTGSVALDENYDPEFYDFYQEFTLPATYTRGSGEDTEFRTPPLTGIQIFVDIREGFQDVAAIDWIIERDVLFEGWDTLEEGIAIGNNISGDEVWFTAYFDNPVSINSHWLTGTGRFRFGVRGRNPGTDTFKEEIVYDQGKITVDGNRYDAILQPGVPFHILIDDVPNVIHQDAASKKVYRSVERGITSFYAATPNPLVTSSAKAYYDDGADKFPLLIGGDESSFLFRILGGTAEDGTDFLGNQYRSTVTKNSVRNITTLDADYRDEYWLSKPNPSKLAVEALYFDITGNFDAPVTVDRILLDPLTPGIYFNVYWSSEGNPGTNDAEWDGKLWTRVPFSFKATKRDTYALPQPITAKYLKIEFANLQPKWYAPGEFQKPTLYKKHPKWVLDYFLIRVAAEENTEDPFISRQVAVDYDALDLAYNYYLDDLNQEPLEAASIGIHNQNDLTQFLINRDDLSDTVDSVTLNQIKTQFFPYLDHPSLRGSGLDYLLAQYSTASTESTTNRDQILLSDLSVEQVYRTQQALSNKVSTINRERLLVEKGNAIMYFYVACRHKYRVVSAKYTHDRAYFAGLREISFMRDRYTVAFDNNQYVDLAGDNMNAERNDLELVDLAWQTYNDSSASPSFVFP